MDAARFTDRSLHRMGDQLIRAGLTADVVARRALRSARKGQLYAIPMWDGRFAWWLKRLFPTFVPGFLRSASDLTLKLMGAKNA